MLRQGAFALHIRKHPAVKILSSIRNIILSKNAVVEIRLDFPPPKKSKESDEVNSAAGVSGVAWKARQGARTSKELCELIR